VPGLPADRRDPMESFTVHLLFFDDIALVTPCGPAERVAEEMLGPLLLQLDPGLHAVVLDMAHVSFMSTGGLRLLDRLLNYGAENGVHVVTVGWQAQPRRVLGSRTDRFVPPPTAPRDAQAADLVRAVEARALRALAQGASFDDGSCGHGPNGQ